ncbi:MAG: hypothetical protein RL510_978 [Actinomycetota bacterium]|jgi:heme/copper-type cytochrome/quinol oxidase subunit 2
MFLNVAHEHAVHYPFPAFWFGAIAFGVFLLLAVVTWSYRDVANRHEHKVNKDSKGHH